MNTFGKRSQDHLATCDPDLQVVASSILKHMDVSVLEGYRTLVDQLQAFNDKRSKVKRGKHNVKPSRAMHLAPYPYQQTDVRPYYFLGGLVKAEARRLGIKIRWGGDWDGDGDIFDQTFNDLMHYELEDYVAGTEGRN